MPPPKIKQLIVEGQDDKFAVLGLVRARLNWPADVNNAPVWIEVGGSADEILEPGYITAELKARDIETLGVMLDADTKPRSRYGRIRKHCAEYFPNLPAELPPSGCVAQNPEKKRLGVWIMPDNVSDGSLETFLRNLVPDKSEPVWNHATQSVLSAKKIGAACRECHAEKAHLYTWLAWQDPPGQSPGTALAQRILNPYSPNADGFMKWFLDLYQLAHLIPPADVTRAITLQSEADS